MIKVITYGTYDLLHYGHIRLLERAKSLGDYLIVGVTADDFDKTRGKINVQQTLMERVEAVKATGLADEVVVEEYEGQKIDDIRRYNVDIFTVGSDWKGKFDYLNEYCKVVYLERTQGVSSSDIRDEKRKIRLGIVGNSSYAFKYVKEAGFVNGVEVIGFYDNMHLNDNYGFDLTEYRTFSSILEDADAIYISSHPRFHYEQIKKALINKKHVLCESPIAINAEQCSELIELAKINKCILMDGIKTAYSTAYYRLLLLVKSGKIGDVASVEATCTSLRLGTSYEKHESTLEWGPTALLPVFQILGTNYTALNRITKNNNDEDLFTLINIIYPNAVAIVKIANGVKSEGELIISGTKGYVYVPAPWWKTDYFEVRYENIEENRRYYYQLDGEGIRYEIVAFIKAIEDFKNFSYISNEVSLKLSELMEIETNYNI